MSAFSGVFPLGFGGESIHFARHQLIQFFKKFLHVVPINIFHRAVIAAFVVKFGRVAAHHGLPLCLGDFVLADAKGLDIHLVGAFVIISFFVSTAHGEGAAGYGDHVLGYLGKDEFLVLPLRSLRVFIVNIDGEIRFSFRP